MMWLLYKMWHPSRTIARGGIELLYDWNSRGLVVDRILALSRAADLVHLLLIRSQNFSINAAVRLNYDSFSFSRPVAFRVFGRQALAFSEHAAIERQDRLHVLTSTLHWLFFPRRVRCCDHLLNGLTNYDSSRTIATTCLTSRFAQLPPGERLLTNDWFVLKDLSRG